MHRVAIGRLHPYACRLSCLMHACVLRAVQAFNFAFKDTIKNMFPKANPKTDFWKFFMINLASGEPLLRVIPRSLPLL